MKYTKRRIAFVIVNLAIVAALFLFGLRSAIIQPNGAFMVKPQDWLGLGLMIAWLIGGVYLLKKFRRPR